MIIFPNNILLNSDLLWRQPEVDSNTYRGSVSEQDVAGREGAKTYLIRLSLARILPDWPKCRRGCALNRPKDKISRRCVVKWTPETTRRHRMY